jgi:hypothetical protein
MAFKLVHARYDDKSKRVYVELRDADDDGGEMLASAAFQNKMARGVGQNRRSQKRSPDK